MYYPNLEGKRSTKLNETLKTSEVADNTELINWQISHFKNCMARPCHNQVWNREIQFRQVFPCETVVDLCDNSHVEHATSTTKQLGGTMSHQSSGLQQQLIIIFSLTISILSLYLCVYGRYLFPHQGDTENVLGLKHYLGALSWTWK